LSAVTESETQNDKLVVVDWSLCVDGVSVLVLGLHDLSAVEISGVGVVGFGPWALSLDPYFLAAMHTLSRSNPEDRELQ
jgi:hypothetical protein